MLKVILCKLAIGNTIVGKGKRLSILKCAVVGHSEAVSMVELLLVTSIPLPNRLLKKDRNAYIVVG